MNHGIYKGDVQVKRMNAQKFENLNDNFLEKYKF